MMQKSALNQSTILSPHHAEHLKTPQQKAEDVIYTLNHSFTCLLVTDTFGLAGAANLVNSAFGTKFNLSHDDNHGYGAFNWVWDRLRGKHKDSDYVGEWHDKENYRIAHDITHAQKHAAQDLAAGRKPTIHPSPAPKLTPEMSGQEAGRKLWSTTRKWLFAEAVGDLGAVPFTIFLQRCAPGFMDWVRKGIEPIVGGPFKRNTRRAAVNWGHAHGKAENSEEVNDRARQLYEYEMRHLPQMAVWTISSVGLNLGAMHLFHKIDPHQFERTSLREFAMVKGLGAAFTAALVLGVRGLTPGGAHTWDQTIGKKVIVPVTKTVGGLFGVKGEDVDQFQRNRDQMDMDKHGPQVKTPDNVTVTEREHAGRVAATQATMSTSLAG